MATETLLQQPGINLEPLLRGPSFDDRIQLQEGVPVITPEYVTGDGGRNVPVTIVGYPTPNQAGLMWSAHIEPPSGSFQVPAHEFCAIDSAFDKAAYAEAEAGLRDNDTVFGELARHHDGRWWENNPGRNAYDNLELVRGVYRFEATSATGEVRGIPMLNCDAGLTERGSAGVRRALDMAVLATRGKVLDNVTGIFLYDNETFDEPDGAETEGTADFYNGVIYVNTGAARRTEEERGDGTGHEDAGALFATLHELGHIMDLAADVSPDDRPRITNEPDSCFGEEGLGWEKRPAADPRSDDRARSKPTWAFHENQAAGEKPFGRHERTEPAEDAATSFALTAINARVVARDIPRRYAAVQRMIVRAYGREMEVARTDIRQITPTELVTTRRRLASVSLRAYVRNDAARFLFQ